jgi:methylthioribose-1-phosphate isomerase
LRSLTWQHGCLRLLDQTALPGRTAHIDCRDWRRVAEAIRKLEVRGAPAIGAAAAFGLVLAARELAAKPEDFRPALLAAAGELRATRPTAVNLFWALDRMLSVAGRYRDGAPPSAVVAALEEEALAIAREDEAVNNCIAMNGAPLIPPGSAVLTHCNAGSLATVAFGTALGVIGEAWRQGRISRVFADETRPLLQGARLTAWELVQEGIPVTLITDNMAGWVMKRGMVQAAIVGADRITAGGDVANKIGTYTVAVLAQRHAIPFYVAAPLSTFDFSLDSGDDIPIEERNPAEVTGFGGVRTAPEGVDVFNPAFDVTPGELVTAIITEHGVLRPPLREAIAGLRDKKGGR